MLIVADSKTPLPEKSFGRLGDLRVLETPAINRESLRDADMVVVRSETKVNQRLLEGTGVRFVGTATIGTDHVDVGYLRARGIGFASAPGSNAKSVAEYVVAALLELGHRRRLPLEGKTIGVVGVGNVGTRVARMARALGMEVLLNDPPLARLSGDSRYLALDDLMSADIVTLHVPLTYSGDDPTFHLFDEQRITRLKPGVILVNTSRGPVVDAKPLQKRLVSGELGGAVLDVWEGEPEIDVELLAATDLGTPHIAGYSHDGKVNAARMIFDSASRFFGIDAQWFGDGDESKTENLRFAFGNDSAESIVRVFVRHCYDIEVDDTLLRGLHSLQAERRGEYFRRLRSTYRLRREFFHYAPEVPQEHRDLIPVLRDLGFRPLPSS